MFLAPQQVSVDNQLTLVSASVVFHDRGIFETFMRRLKVKLKMFYSSENQFSHVVLNWVSVANQVMEIFTKKNIRNCKTPRSWFL